MSKVFKEGVAVANRWK